MVKKTKDFGNFFCNTVNYKQFIIRGIDSVLQNSMFIVGLSYIFVLSLMF